MLLDLEAWKTRLQSALDGVTVKIAETVSATAEGIQVYPCVYICNPGGQNLETSGSQMRGDSDRTRISLVFKFRRLGDLQGSARIVQMTEAIRIARVTFCGDRRTPGWICPDAFAGDQIKMVDYATDTINNEILRGVLVLTVKTQI